MTTSSQDFSTLQNLSNVLHLFHHRNKNQHRRSVWWRHFSLFRKQLQQYITSLQHLSSAPTTNLEKARKKLQDGKFIRTNAARLNFCRDVMVPKWHHAFSQAIADGRFAILGLVLMAALAEFCRIVGITVELEEMGQAEVEKVLKEFGKEEWGGNGGREDVGEVITRTKEEYLPLAVPVDNEPRQADVEKVFAKHSVRKKRLPTESREPAKKKKRKTGNAIDDIFG